jgi:hypothetical protein
MLPYSESDFCKPDDGLDYVFGKMSAIYGSVFTRLTYRPKIDYALKHMSPERPPSALAFAKLLNDGPRIPDKPNFHIGMDKPLAKDNELVKKTLADIRKMVEAMK